MGTAGLIFGAIAVAWLAYLVPWFLGQRDQAPAAAAEPDEIAARMRVVSSGPEVASPAIPVDVSTALTRRAAVRELKQLSRKAAKRRAVTTSALLSACTLFGFTNSAGWTSSWPMVLSGVLLAGYLIVARVSVQSMNAQLDARLREVKLGDDEATIAVRLVAPTALLDAPDLDKVAVAPLATPPSGALWEPIPVTAPTYVSAPLAPRTVRTIDLSAPDPADLPVTADPEVPAPQEGGQEPWRRAAGN